MRTLRRGRGAEVRGRHVDPVLRVTAILVRICGGGARVVRCSNYGSVMRAVPIFGGLPGSLGILHNARMLSDGRGIRRLPRGAHLLQRSASSGRRRQAATSQRLAGAPQAIRRGSARRHRDADRACSSPSLAFVPQGKMGC